MYCAERSESVVSLQLSAEDYLSRGKWLLFLNSAKIEEFFISIHVPFDCEFLVAQFSDAAELSLTEVYRTRADLPLRSLRIAEENAGRELMWSNVSFIQRRGNLEGLVIRGSVVEHVCTILDYPDHHLRFSGSKNNYNFKTCKILIEHSFT
ncbi:hypothetical protein ANN_07751 [Periplaneta americana]|uniref:Uncharacterized protein n=1 Tax=Periplaneta americana TaxID=6978 RepID=A0ABQ8T0V6_PERAM|nr:hypothetical protein ANN_07751 [Periplaneta americana]